MQWTRARMVVVLFVMWLSIGFVAQSWSIALASDSTPRAPIRARREKNGPIVCGLSTSGVPASRVATFDERIRFSRDQG